MYELLLWRCQGNVILLVFQSEKDFAFLVTDTRRTIPYSYHAYGTLEYKFELPNVIEVRTSEEGEKKVHTYPFHGHLLYYPTFTLRMLEYIRGTFDTCGNCCGFTHPHKKHPVPFVLEDSREGSMRW